MADETNVVLTANTSQYERSVDQATSSTNKMIGAVSALTLAIDGAFKSAGRSMQIGGAGMTASITAMGFAAGRLEQQMSQLQASMSMVSKTQEMYEVRVRSFGKAVTSLRAEFGMTSQEAIGLVTQLNKLGQADRNVQALAQSFTRLGAVSGEGVSGLVQGMIQLQRTMGTEGTKQTQVFNASLAQLSQTAGASATGILQFAQAIAPVAKVSGMTQKEVMGVSTAFVKSGADGYAAANAFNKMLTDITRSIQYGSPELKAYSNLIGVSVEQFKELPRTEAITRVFEEINKQGPSAIKTLERFGLDGIRTYKSLQAVAGQGGIRSAVAEAMGGDEAKLGTASQKAFDGLNDQLKRIAENGKMIAEAFGSGVLPVMEKVARAINGILSPLRAVLQGLGSLPGGAMALAGLGMMAAGTVTRAFTGLSTFGMLTGGYRTVRGGMRAGQGADLSAREMRQLDSYTGGTGMNWLQRMMYGGGVRIGEMQARQAGGGSIGLGAVGQRALGMGRAGGSALIRGFGSMLGAGLAPLSFNTYANNADRDDRYRTFTEARARDSFGWRAAQTQYNAFRGAMGSQPHAEAAAAARLAAGLNSAAAASTAHSTATRTLMAETLRLGGAMGQATITTMRIAGTGALNLGGAALRRGGSALMSGLGTVTGALGGGVGIGLMAGMYGYSKWNESRAANLDMLRNEDNTGPGGAYAAALGEASAATRTFAEVVRSQAAVIASQGFTTAPSAAQADLAARSPGAYTFAGMRGASSTEQMAYAQLLYASNPSDKALAAMQRDLLRTNGTDPAGQLAVKTIMETASANRNPNLAALFTGAYNADTWMIGTSDAARGKASAAGSGIQQMLAAAPNATAAAGVGLAALNQLGLSAKGTRSWWGAKRGGVEAQASAYVRGILGKSGTQADIDAVTDAIYASGGNSDKLRQYIAQNGPAEGIGGAVENMTRTAQAGGLNVNSTVAPSNTLYRSDWQAAGVEDIVRGRMQVGNPLMRSIFGQRDSDSSAAVRAAVGNQGDVAAQWTGMRAMGDEAMKLSSGFAQASASLDQLKAAAGDASSPLYQLAIAARGYVRQRQSEAMGFMSTSGRAQELVANYRADYKENLLRPTGESGQNMEASRGAVQGLIQSTYDRLKSYVLAVREFNVARERGEENYQRQRGYAEDDFNRQRQYSLDDFNKSRMRAEEDFNHQVLVMARATARQMTNIYERLNVQRTWSAANLLQNMRDQQSRLAEQQANLAKLRRAGLSDDAINQMGLNDPQNMQQLARLADDAINDPAMIAAFNKAIAARLKLGKDVATDPSNEQFKEMRRNFKVNMDRQETDFNIALARQSEQFDISLARMEEAYNIGMTQAAEDLNRGMEEITGSFNEMADAAMRTLTGSSKDQMTQLLHDLGYVKGKVYTMTDGLVKDMNDLYGKIGITPSGPMAAYQPGGSVYNSQVPKQSNAEGGEIKGYSPHPKADNILSYVTAGEYVQPVDAVNYYGKDFMEAIRTKSLPKFASGGMVYKQMEAWMKTNLPGVAITSDYRPGAITALGNVSMHAQGKAVDMAPSMETFNKILSAFGSKIYQLFYSPADGRTILRGKPWHMDPVTKRDHWNHVHWAMQSMDGLMNAVGGDPSALLAMVSGMPHIKAYDKMMTNAHPYALRAHGNGFLPRAIAAMLAAQSGGVSVDYSEADGSGMNAIKAMVQSMAASRGWTGTNWNALNQLVQHESGWNPTAQNPTSTAYGLFQFLNSTWKTVGGHKTSDPRLQAQYGLKYIANRYGDPSRAWAFWNSHTPHWYGDGAIFNKASQIGVGERGPEAVMPLNQRGVDFMFELMKKNSTDARRAMVATGGVPQQASTISYYSRVDKSTIISGPITVQAQDPDEMLRKIEAKKKMEALKGRH